MRHAPRTWYGRMDRFMMSLGFTKSKADSNLYFKFEGKRPEILLLYVDDMFITSEDELIKDGRRRLNTEFKMKYLGMMQYFLGMEVCQSADVIFLGQGKYVVYILKRFKMLDYKEIATPMAYNYLKLLSDASYDSVDPTIYR